MRRLRVYKKTVSIVNETATGMYASLVGDKKGFLLESYDKKPLAGLRCNTEKNRKN